MNILVVDDSKAMRMIVLRNLKQAGFENHNFIEAENGKDALAKINASPPDLILSDWNMPEMKGIELLQELKKAGKAIKFGFVTSESTDEIKNLAKENGALFVITKPFTAETFKMTLEGIVK
ncbi:response regulator [bacterium]|nr:response regulator [bacterium]